MEWCCATKAIPRLTEPEAEAGPHFPLVIIGLRHGPAFDRRQWNNVFHAPTTPVKVLIPHHISSHDLDSKAQSSMQECTSRYSVFWTEDQSSDTTQPHMARVALVFMRRIKVQRAHTELSLAWTPRVLRITQQRLIHSSHSPGTPSGRTYTPQLRDSDSLFALGFLVGKHSHPNIRRRTAVFILGRNSKVQRWLLSYSELI